jgi:acetyltransferase-like isoleucine patch superfamily enzyme
MPANRTSPSRLRRRVRAAVAQRLRAWIEGPDMLFDGDPHRRIVTDGPTHAPVRLLQYGPTDGEPIRIGKYSALNHHAQVFHGGQHRADWISVANIRWDGPRTGLPPAGSPTSRGPVVIGNDVHIGWDAVVFSGITIGDGAVIGARAVVVNDVEPYAVMLGNPARQVGWRFDEQTREALLRIRWWDWPEDVVNARIDELLSADVATFVAKYDPRRLEPPVATQRRYG